MDTQAKSGMVGNYAMTSNPLSKMLWNIDSQYMYIILISFSISNSDIS